MCDRFDIGRNVYMGRLTCLLLMNKDLFSLLGWNNIFGVNTNSDHVPRRGINGRDIYFHKNVRLWPILCEHSLCLSRSLSPRISCVGHWWTDVLSGFSAGCPSLFSPFQRWQRLPTSALIKHFLCLPPPPPSSPLPRPVPVLAVPVSPAKT